MVASIGFHGIVTFTQRFQRFVDPVFRVLDHPGAAGTGAEHGGQRVVHLGRHTGFLAVTDKILLYGVRVVGQRFFQLIGIDFQVTDGTVRTFYRVLGNPSWAMI
jgi:hypothetical protein